MMHAVMPALLLAAAGQVEFLEETFAYDEAMPAAGQWLGNVESTRAGATWAALSITSDAEATITLLSAMAVNASCVDVRIDGRSVAFTLPQAGARFEGTVSPDGQRLAGSITLKGAEGEGSSFELARTPRPLDLARPLAYGGELESPFGNLAMTFVFAETPGGNWVGQIDVPGQGMLGVPLTRVRRTGRTVLADFAVPMNPARIEAELAEDESRLAGRFRQGGFDLAFDFARRREYVQPVMRRPQEPKPPFPYTTHEVTIEHEDGHVLAGTLTVPPAGRRHPAVVLISGSGPQDRDESLPFGHKPFLVLADYLTRRGIAVLRYDDRGVGASTGDFSGATSADLATDALAALRFLESHPEIGGGPVGLVGHSEGALIAAMVAARTPDADFIVLLAGTGVPGDEVLRVQGELILRANGAAEDAIARLKAQQERIFSLVLEGADESSLEAARPMLRQQIEVLTGLEGEMLDQAVEMQVQQLGSPWMRFFLTYDPRPTLGRVRCPVLAVNGTLDLQVWHEQNLPEIEKALGAADVTVRRYEGLNHLFQPAETGSIMEYATIETTFDEGVMADIVEWVRSRTGE